MVLDISVHCQNYELYCQRFIGKCVSLGGSEPVPSATTPRSEPYSLQPEHPPTMGTTNQFPTVTPTPDVPMYPPPRNQTPDSGFHASPRSQSQMTNGGVSEPEELRSLHLEVSRLREENGRLRLELDKSHAGESMEILYGASHNVHDR